MKYRKKPVVVDATQWFKNGDHPDDYVGESEYMIDGVQRTMPRSYSKENNWEGFVVRYFRRPDIDGNTRCRHCELIMHEHGWIDTLEGGHIVCPGDFVITGVQGEYYPCKWDIFVATYDPLVAAQILQPFISEDK